MGSRLREARVELSLCSKLYSELAPEAGPHMDVL